MISGNLALSGEMFEDLFLPKDNTKSNNRPYWIDNEEFYSPEQKTDESTNPALEEQSETIRVFPGSEPSPAIFFRPEKVRDKPFLSLQKWQGVVVEVFSDYFKANIFDLYNDGVQEIAEIPIEEVLPEDNELLKPGGVFYWNIGYDDPFGTRRRTSLILFRRLPKKTKSLLRSAKAEAEKMGKSLEWGK